MANQELNVDDVVFVRNLAGAEDLLFGTGTEQQIRDGEIVLITRINATTIPYRKSDGSLISVGEALDELYNANANRT